MLNKIDFNINYKDGIGKHRIYNPNLSDTTLQLKFKDYTEIFKEGEIKSFSEGVVNVIFDNYPYFLNPDAIQYKVKDYVQKSNESIHIGECERKEGFVKRLFGKFKRD